MANVFSKINNLLETIDQFLGVDSKRGDSKHSEISNFRLKTDIDTKYLQMAKDFINFTETNLFYAILAEKEEYILAFIDYLERNGYPKEGKQLKRIFETRVINSEFYKQNQYMNFDFLNLTDGEKDIFINLEKIFINEFLVTD